MDKNKIRKQIKLNLADLSNQDKQSKILLIFDKLKRHDDFINAKSIFIYVSFSNEPITKQIINYCFENNKRVYVPQIDGENMYAIEIFKNTKFKKNAYGIDEPIIKGNKIINNYDISIIPLVGFDSFCNRLGRGKGYYDKYLSKVKGLNIGLAYECQKIKNIPTEPHDVKLDYVITEKQIYCK